MRTQPPCLGLTVHVPRLWYLGVPKLVFAVQSAYLGATPEQTVLIVAAVYHAHCLHPKT